MFTGIVEEVGSVGSLARAGGGYHLAVKAHLVVSDVALGDSISVNGTCLTVTSFDGTGFAVGLSPETLRRTNLGELRPGDRVNLERALRPGDRMGGHYVQGHVDAVGTVADRRQEGDSLIVTIGFPKELGKFVVEKGFIAIDGVSLTVTASGEDWLSVALIPFTQQVVTLPEKRQGARVNLEVDIIAKYVESILSRREQPGRVTRELLAEQGYL